MKFLLDVNVGTRIARALGELGHDVVRVVLDSPRAADTAILARAVLEKRVLISCDSDFTDLIYLDGAEPPPAMIYIRLEPEDVREVVDRLIPLLDFELLGDHMTVIGPVHTRRRPFPRKAEDND